MGLMTPESKAAQMERAIERSLLAIIAADRVASEQDELVRMTSNKHLRDVYTHCLQVFLNEVFDTIKDNKVAIDKYKGYCRDHSLPLSIDILRCEKEIKSLLKLKDRHSDGGPEAS